MQTAEYFDSVASLWDDDFAESKAARVMAASLSLPESGGYVLDVGCGGGAMFLDLLDWGAYEIEGIDVSEKMAAIAKAKYQFDPRIRVEQGDFLEHERAGYDLIIAFNSYQHFPIPRLFLKKARELLCLGGRLTVAFPFDRERMNLIDAAYPAGVARGLLTAEEEAVFWRDDFRVDCLCDNTAMYLISGVVKK